MSKSVYMFLLAVILVIGAAYLGYAFGNSKGFAAGQAIGKAQGVEEGKALGMNALLNEQRQKEEQTAKAAQEKIIKDVNPFNTTVNPFSNGYTNPFSQ
ncbi:hypothetical protein HY249_03460 [Candidatus Azambacteria bacterium]|nr:hypothetical protein [Candidatus Azambacteria bacterium]